MKHYEYEISLFIDDELGKESEEEFFSHLAACENCRRMMSDYILLKQKTGEVIAEQISSFDEPAAKTRTFYKAGFYIAAAAAILLIFILVQQNPEIPSAKPVPHLAVDSPALTNRDSHIITSENNNTSDEKLFRETNTREASDYELSRIPVVRLTKNDLIKADIKEDL